MKHRYTLEKYKGPSTRYTCLSCGQKREFTRYIDTETGEHLSPWVGKCNRMDNCGWHLTPREFFKYTRVPRYIETGRQKRAEEFKRVREKKLKTHMPKSLLERSLHGQRNDRFSRYLHTLFEPDVVARALDVYLVGSWCSPVYWRNNSTDDSMIRATVFWFVNKALQIRYGQVKLFYDNGHTAKYTFTGRDNAMSSCTTGIHFLLAQDCRYGKFEIPQWLVSYEAQDIKIDCFFGEHLLGVPDYANRPVAIVEAPKTAIIASVCMPQYTWLAVGSLSYLTAERCRVLAGKEVTLYPDLGAYDKWLLKARELQPLMKCTISSFLEKMPEGPAKVNGMDIADYLTTNTSPL